ncbi:hypothetical protein [Cellulomonas sp. Marseille-Q8402]
MTTRRRPVLLLVHAGTVVVLSVVLLVLALQVTDDANIGAGLALIALVPFGLPWSLPALLGPDTWPSGVAVGIAIGAAALNVVLHGVLRELRHRRKCARAAAG